jgi:hypothetical protein
MHCASLLAAAFITAFLALSPDARAACAELQAAREAYQAGNTQKALGILDCRIQQDSKDLRAKQLQSDILWWENQEEQSEEVATRLYEQPESAALPGLRIALSRRIHRTRASVGAEGISHDGLNTLGLSGELSHRYSGKSYVAASFARPSRIFKNATDSVSDTQFRLAHLGPIARYAYLEASVAYAHDPLFLPEWIYAAQPHYIFADGSDVSLGLKLNAYPSRNVFELAPEWVQPVSARWTLGARANAQFATNFLLAGTLYGEALLSPGFSVRASFSGGRALESASAETDFWSGTLGAGLPLSPRFLVRVNGTLFRGDFRDENRLGGGIDYLF